MTSITGHRGARNLWPENSLTGFRNVLDLAVEAVEFDVHLTQAGELLVIHDATLERTTEGSGPVCALTPAARRATKLKGAEEAVPTLEEVLTVLAAAAERTLHVELKSDENGQPYPGIEERVVGELERFGLTSRSVLTSFDLDVLAQCRRTAPGIERLVSLNGQSAARHGGLAAFLQAAQPLAGLLAVHHDLLEAQWETVSAAVPRERLCVWTLNEEPLIARWLDRDVGHLTTDRPDLALRLRGLRANQPSITSLPFGDDQ